MGDYNTMQGVYSMPYPGGVLYMSYPVPNEVKAAYEDWMEGSARLRVFDLRKELGERAFQESMMAATRASAAHTFAWGGDAWIDSIRQLPGVVKLFTLLANTDTVRAAHPGQKVDEESLLGILSAPDMRTVIGEALDKVLYNAPNFLCPPTRGRGV